MKPGQSTFDERVARINSGRTVTPDEVQPASHRTRALKAGAKARKLYLNIMVYGSIAGGLAGLLFAQKVGLPYALTLDGAALYTLSEDAPMMLVYIALAAFGPVFWVLGQVLARGNPKARRFWFGYASGVIASNWKDIEPHAAPYYAEYAPLLEPYVAPVVAYVTPRVEMAYASLAPHLDTVMAFFA